MSDWSILRDAIAEAHEELYEFSDTKLAQMEPPERHLFEKIRAALAHYADEREAYDRAKKRRRDA